MILGMNQPYFFPYLGYWQLMNLADLYILYDDVNFIKGGWIHRNKIKINQEGAYFNLKIRKASQNKRINELEISMTKEDYRLLLEKIRNAYAKAPYRDQVLGLLQDIFSCGETNLAFFLEYAIKKTAAYMGIETPIYSATRLQLDHTHRGFRRIVDICHQMNCDTYINAIGGKELYTKEEFAEENIKLGFLRMNDDITYEQGKDDFIAGLSIVDVLMYNNQDEVKALLTRYTLE